MRNAAVAALAGMMALGIALAAAQSGGEAAVEVTVWRSVSQPSLLYVSTRPEGGSWLTRDTPLDMSALDASGRFHQGSAVPVQVSLEDGDTAAVEVTVFRSVPNQADLYVGARVAGGSWRMESESVDMSALSKSRWFYQSKALLVRIPLPARTSAPGEAAMAACANGVAVPDPANNPGLVRDCAVLLEALGTLLGDAGSADWSADTPIPDWSGVTVDGSPPRVAHLVSSTTGPTLTGRIPPVLGQLSHLRYLGFYNQQLMGAIPPELGSLTNLGLVELFGNQLSGEIPPELGQLSNLGGLWLAGNQLTGGIPPELGQLSSLRDLSLTGNQLTGEIPPELGRLSNLRRLYLSRNMLTGEIPGELGQLSRLEQLGLDVWGDGFTGVFPTELGALSNLTYLGLRTRQMTGCIPPALQRFASYWYLPFCRDSVAPSTLPPPDPQLVQACSQGGAVPDPDDNPGLVNDCAVLLEARNTLTSDPDLLNWSADIPITTWAGITVEGSPHRVAEISLPYDRLGGQIPAGLARLSNLRELWLSGNQLTGEIPPELGQLWNLKHLWLYGNELTGEIPPELAELRFLERLWLSDNQLTGGIPPEIGAISSLEYLELRRNRLTGTIPLALVALSNLQRLELGGNQLSGGIPPELSSMWSLRGLDLGDNELTGEIPPEFMRGRIQGLDLWISGNRLTGCMPLWASEVFRDYEDLGLSYCECPASLNEGASPDLTVGADGIPFMPHAATEAAGSYRVTFSLVVDLPAGGRFSLGQKQRNDAGEIIVSIREERSRSTLVIDPFTGAEHARSVIEGPPDCDVSVSDLFDQIVTSARVQRLDLPAGHDGIQGVHLLQPAEGGRTYRIGGRFIADVPEGMRLTDEGHGYVCVDPGGCYTTLTLRDEESSSVLTLDASTGDELSRWVAEEAAGRDVGALFDHITASIREDPPSTCALATAAPDCALLLEMKELLAGDGELNWSADLPIASWDGVAVNRWTGRVIVLDLTRQDVTGQIPPALGQLSELEVLELSAMTGEIPLELGSLSNLRTLSLRWNSLTGGIPPELGQLSNLRVLHLFNNGLSGEIPPELGSLANLRELDLGWNQQLTGAIPPELGQLSNLRKLDLSITGLGGDIPLALVALSNLQELDLSGSFTGGIPPELASLSSLQKLYLSGYLTGAIPPELGALSNLQVLHLSGSLTGAIPPELGSLSNLQELWLTGDLTGAIPPELGGLWRLRRLTLSGNQLTGEIPAEFGQLWHLGDLGLGDNQLTGEIPAELGQLWYLGVVWLADNQLTGEIPAELGALPELLNMDLSGNRLEGCIPAALERFVRATPDSNPDLRDCAAEQ